MKRDNGGHLQGGNAVDFLVQSFARVNVRFLEFRWLSCPRLQGAMEGNRRPRRRRGCAAELVVEGEGNLAERTEYS